jgi:hypothetical protein
MEQNTRLLRRHLPWSIRKKLDYHMDYINEKLIDIALEEGKISQVDYYRETVEIIFFLRLLRSYFVTGYANYEGMLRFFQQKNIIGFQIGSHVFDQTSRLTVDWSGVATAFDSFVATLPISHYILSDSPDEAVLWKIVRDLL